MLELAYMSIEGMTEREREILYDCVSPERREQLRSRKHRQSADLSLAGEVLARVMLGKAGALHAKEIVIVRDTQGKPGQETVPGLFFNYSHSGTMVACGIAGENIGVDIQKRNDGTKVKEKVYCPAEREDDFTEIWAKKESYLKLTGEGLRREMKTLDVRKMQADGEAQWYGGWVMKDYCLYACVVNSPARETEYKIYQMNLKEMIDLIHDAE